MYKKENDKSKAIATLFISYTTCDRPIVDIIYNKICEKLHNEIKISRFDNLKYKQSFRLFMNTVGEHDFVLAVVSDTYLKSKGCMYEIGEVLKNHHYMDKLVFVVLSESEREIYGEYAPKKIAPNIYDGANSRLNYIFFWENKYNELNKRVKQVISEESKKEIIDELQIIGQIYRKDIGEFLNFLADENGKSFKELYETEFEDLIQLISPSFHLHKNGAEQLIDSQLEELYLRFPQNKEITNSFANSLFKLTQNKEQHIILFAADYLERIYCEHPCMDIAYLLIMSLTNLSVKQDNEGIHKTVARVQSLYHQYSNCLKMAVVYTKCLVNCTYHEETVANAAITQLQKLSEQYEGNIEIALNYASGLFNMCLRHNSQELVDLVAHMEDLYQRYPNEVKIVTEYAKCLEVLSRRQNVSDAILTLKRIEQLCNRTPNIIELLVLYTQCLVNLSVRESDKEIADALDYIENLHNQYPNEQRIVSGYAMCLYNYQRGQKLKDAIKTAKRMEDLYHKFPDVVETSFGLARCLVDLSTKQDEESEKLYIVARLEYLLNKHPNEDIAVGYAIGLYNLSLKQNEYGLRTTLARFEELRKLYPNNERIASEFACFRENAFH